MEDIIELLGCLFTMYLSSEKSKYGDGVDHEDEIRKEKGIALLAFILFAGVITILVSVIVFFKPKHIVKESAVAESKHIIINQEKKVMTKIEHKLNIAKTPIN